jgi:hypothetical protein
MNCEQSVWNTAVEQNRQNYLGMQGTGTLNAAQPKTEGVQDLISQLSALIGSQHEAIQRLEKMLDPILQPQPTEPKETVGKDVLTTEPQLMQALRSMIGGVSWNIGYLAGLQARVRL